MLKLEIWQRFTKLHPGTPTSKSKITTKTVKKHDGSYLNLKIGENLPNKTQVLPPKNQK